MVFFVMLGTLSAASYIYLWQDIGRSTAVSEIAQKKHQEKHQEKHLEVTKADTFIHAEKYWARIVFEFRHNSELWGTYKTEKASIKTLNEKFDIPFTENLFIQNGEYQFISKNTLNPNYSELLVFKIPISSDKKDVYQQYSDHLINRLGITKSYPGDKVSMICSRPPGNLTPITCSIEAQLKNFSFQGLREELRVQSL